MKDKQNREKQEGDLKRAAFERSNRGKSGSLCGLEEVLSCLQRVDFNDAQLSRFRGMSWPEFVAHVDSNRNGTKVDDGETSSSSSDSSPPSPIHPSTPPPQPLPPRQHTCLKGKLVRAQSERCFERSLIDTRVIWRIDRTLTLRPSPLVPTLIEKDLVSPVSTTSRAE
uniref:Uncharacterized protein n=1 Tax=Timema cristinae TaxID=61476 RepID=A0A7R9D832_TIMCR|nr:unnamed protein product [Timema cristinae]